jgi:class 3 adenylate cyclase
VGEHSRQEVARRAGVDPEYVDRLVELGILTPGTEDTFSPGDVRRARWVHSLEVAGVPLDGMAAAVRDGALSFSYLDASAFDQFAEVSGTTFGQLSESTGIPMDLLKVVREAVGFADPQPEDRVREDELSIVQTIELQLSKGFRPVVIERWLRVCGDSLRRLAETETDWWRTEVELPLLEGGMSTAQMLEAQADFGSQIAPFMEQVVLAIYHGQQEHAWSQSALDMVEGVATQGLPPARVGIHAGPVIFQEGDYFGRTVNIAARIAEYARPGEVLVSEEVVDSADGTPVTFTEIGPVELKGVSGAPRLHTARRGTTAGPDVARGANPGGA